MALETSDFGELRELIRAELSPLATSLKNQSNDLREVKEDLKQLRTETYTKELVDAKFDALRTELATIKTVTETNSQHIGSLTERTLSRIALVLSCGYALISILHSLVH